MRRLFALICIPATLAATEFAPWFGRSLEIEWRSTALFQFFNSIATPVKPTHYKSFAQFYTGSLSSSFDRIAIEMEMTCAATHHRSFGLDNMRVTGRYLFLNDVVGDEVSATVGATLSAAMRKAVYDLSSFHHSAFEAEGHLAVGKELSCSSFWVQRGWGLLALGTGTRGRPWVRADLAFERNYWDFQEWQLFAHSLWGLGDRNIHLRREFKGYGLIKHRSVDLGIRYTRMIGHIGGRASFEYARRVYALNFPKNCNSYLFRLTYPFGI